MLRTYFWDFAERLSHLTIIQVSDTVTRAHSSFPSGQSITTAEDQSLEASSGSRHTQDQQLQQRQI